MSVVWISASYQSFGSLVIVKIECYREKIIYRVVCQVRKNYSYHLAWIYDDSEKMVRFSCLEIAILGKLFLMISKNMIS